VIGQRKACGRRIVLLSKERGIGFYARLTRTRSVGTGLTREEGGEPGKGYWDSSSANAAATNSVILTEGRVFSKKKEIASRSQQGDRKRREESSNVT